MQFLQLLSSLLLIFRLFLGGIWLCNSPFQNGEKEEDFDDRDHNFEEICTEHGYEYEKHTVFTTDGYILQLDHIIPRNDIYNTNAPIVLLMHGIEDSSTEWIINTEKLSPAFILSRAGFDIWLGNNRGNDFSLKHETLSVKDEAYWDFDWEEMGLKDDPAIIDYILMVTNQTSIDAYIGHSEGTTQFFAGASLLPDFFADKVKLFIALAPVVRLDHSSNKAMVYIAEIVQPLTAFVKAIGIYDLISLNGSPQKLLSELCGFLPRFCELMTQGFIDWSGNVDNLEREKDKFAHTPAGSGWRNLVHYGQIIKAKQFQRYDFGSKEQNKKAYGQDSPPLYDISRIRTPTAIFHGDIDALADPIDVSWLINGDSGFNSSLIVHEEILHAAHNTFTIGKNMSYIHNSIIPLIKEAHNNTLFSGV